jgi:hypothetical protein
MSRFMTADTPVVRALDDVSTRSRATWGRSGSFASTTRSLSSHWARNSIPRVRTARSSRVLPLTRSGHVVSRFLKGPNIDAAKVMTPTAGIRPHLINLPPDRTISSMA